MCGRYSLAVRPADIRRQLRNLRMEADDVPGDDDVRHTYNFAPGYNGIVYRADVPDSAARYNNDQQDSGDASHGQQAPDEGGNAASGEKEVEIRYKLQAMKWGLIPFWTKRNPDYGTLMRTINCRDDSLETDSGMWTSMKRRKRCIVICQGFYEWLKKNNGRERIPHFIHRKDGQLLCLAGLWDCVKYEDSEDQIYSYTIITTDVSKQLSFLHDRMPVILEPDSEAMRAWLDPHRTTWSGELQSILKPYGPTDILEAYPVSKDVGKVGNNSPSFIVPIDSKENKNNIANFFGSQKKKQQETKVDSKVEMIKKEEEAEGAKLADEKGKPEKPIDEFNGDTVPSTTSPTRGIKREHEDDDDDNRPHEVDAKVKEEEERSPTHHPHKAQKTQGVTPQTSPTKTSAAPTTRKQTRSATSNNSASTAQTAMAKGVKSPDKAAGNAKITSFFGK